MEVGYQVAGVIRRRTFNFVTVLLYNYEITISLVGIL